MPQEWVDHLRLSGGFLQLEGHSLSGISKLSKKTKKHRKKALKEQKKALLYRERVRKRSSQDEFPKIVIHEAGASESVVKMVKNALADFDFRDPTVCSPPRQNVYRMLKQLGAVEVLRRFVIARKEFPQHGFKMAFLDDALLSPLYNHVGAWIYRRLPESVRQNPLPFYYFCAQARGHHIDITFDFLEKRKSPHGIIYHAPDPAEVSFGGGKWAVGWFRHAIERACLRLRPDDELSYEFFRYCQLYFHDCIYYEPLELADGSPAIRLYQECIWGADEEPDLYARELLGVEEFPGASCRLCYVLGYCPIAFVGRFAVAKTFLYPGYHNTPEDTAVRRASLDPDERHHLLGLARHNMSNVVFSGEGMLAIKWYHNNGVPQIKELREAVFRKSSGLLPW